MPPPPSYDKLAEGYTTMFRLESQFPFINFEVELTVSGDPQLCNFRVFVSQVTSFEFDPLIPINCNKIRGVNKWIFLSLGLNFLNGQAKLGLVYEDFGQIVTRNQIQSGISQMQQSLGATDWKDVKNTFSFGGLKKGVMVSPLQNRGTAFKIKNWSMADWFSLGDQYDYGRALLGEESIYFKLEPIEDRRIFAFDVNPDGNRFVDASFHRHWIELINTNLFANPYSSYWLREAYFFDNPETLVPLTTPTQSLSSSFNLQYSVPYVLSFWFKTHDVDPTGPRIFRILTFGVLDPAEAQKPEDRVDTPLRD